MGITFTIKHGEEKGAQQTLSTGRARMLTGTCTEMIWRNWFKQTGILTKLMYNVAEKTRS